MSEILGKIGHEMVAGEDGRFFHKMEFCYATMIPEKVGQDPYDGNKPLQNKQQLESTFKMLNQTEAIDENGDKMKIEITRIFIWVQEGILYGEAFFKVKE